MNSLLYIFRFLFRIRWWLIICPSALAGIVWLMTNNLPRSYEVKSTIYTGVVSGYDINSNDGGSRQDWNSINNAMDNIINIIIAQTTLRNVSMRLYAQHMIHGDPNKDNNYITAKNYRAIHDNKTPPAVLALIDNNSEMRTIENLYAYEQASSKNFIYGLFYWSHRHYSYESLKKISVRRVGSSDMLELKYMCDDPGIAYNTLKILNEEFVVQYKALRFGETNDVLKYFEQELEAISRKLRNSEDSLTNYNVDKRVINYDEQTKHIAALSRDYELRYENILLEYNGAQKLIAALESRIDEHVKQLRNNTSFINKINNISQLSAEIATIESFNYDSIINPSAKISLLRNKLKEAEDEFAQFTDMVSGNQYTKEGIASTSFVQEWLVQVMRFEKAKAELTVMGQRKEELDLQYSYYSPIGSTIKRKEREIDFTEQSYITTLHSLNAARLRQKSLQMTSATLKVINPPTYPISPIPTKRKIMVAGTFIGSILFILGFFILMELLDRTLRNKLRTERITGGKVLGAFPARSRFRFRAFNNAWKECATQYASNSILSYFEGKKPFQINVLSTESGDGKSTIVETLKEHWIENGLRVKTVSWNSDFDPKGKSYVLSQGIEDLCSQHDADIDVIILELPPLQQYSTPRGLLNSACLNLMVTRADRVWKDTDQLLYDKTIEKIGSSPMGIYLMRAEAEVVENFTGLLPPFTYFRKLSYRISQLGLTSKA